MKNRVQTLTTIFITVLLVVSGCNTAQKALNRGDYEQSATMTINKLRSKPNDKKARNIFQQAWPLAVEWNENEIDEMMRSSDPFKWVRIADAYASLERMSENVRRCPACLEMIDRPPSYLDQWTEANEKAAEANYDAGMRLMQDPTRDKARQATVYFRNAENRIRGYRDANERLIDALEIATLKVLVEHMPVNLRRYELSNDFFRDEVYRFIENDNRANPYVRFYTPGEVDDELFEDIDHILRIEFVDFTVGQVTRNSDTREVFSKDSVKIGETRMPDGKNQAVYGIVKARYTEYRKTVESGGEIEVRIEDAHSGRLLDTRRFQGSFVWSETWATYNGDERALTDAQVRLARKRELPPPPDQDLFIEFTKPVHSQITEYIRRYYRGY
jgi:hypothetical protein